MKKIFKYNLQATGFQILSLPAEALVLSVIEQYGEMVLYALVDPAAGTKAKSIQIVGTGHPVESEQLDGYRFVNTVKLQNGTLMFHVFVST